MTQRAVAIRFSDEAIDENGNIVFSIQTIYIDTAVPGASVKMAPTITLNPATPATWNADIKALMAATGVLGGFSTLTTATCNAPQYA